MMVLTVGGHQSANAVGLIHAVPCRLANPQNLSISSVQWRHFSWNPWGPPKRKEIPKFSIVKPGLNDFYYKHTRKQ